MKALETDVHNLWAMNYQFDCVGQLVLITNILLAKLCKIMVHKESLRDGEIIV